MSPMTQGVGSSLVESLADFVGGPGSTFAARKRRLACGQRRDLRGGSNGAESDHGGQIGVKRAQGQIGRFSQRSKTIGVRHCRLKVVSCLSAVWAAFTIAKRVATGKSGTPERGLAASRVVVSAGPGAQRGPVDSARARAAVPTGRERGGTGQGRHAGAWLGGLASSGLSWPGGAVRASRLDEGSRGSTVRPRARRDRAGQARRSVVGRPRG